MSVHFRRLICAVPGGNMPANFRTLKAMAQIDNAPAVAPTTVLRFMVFRVIGSNATTTAVHYFSTAGADNPLFELCGRLSSLRTVRLALIPLLRGHCALCRACQSTSLPAVPKCMLANAAGRRD